MRFEVRLRSTCKTFSIHTLQFQLFVLPALFLGNALCIPVSPAAEVKIESQSQSISPEGLGYDFEYTLSDGTFRQETAFPNLGQDFLTISGQFGYIGPDGIKYVVTYLANNDGFSPHGDHLPGQEKEEQEFKPPQTAPVDHDISPGVIKTLVG